MEILSPVFARITKVDELRREVTGRATQEMVDRDNEIFDYATSKPNFMKWSAEVFQDTGGKSLGNVRAMHGSVAAGVLTDIQFDDIERAIDVTAKIVDDQEWRKVLSGTYSGFSIGGRYTKKWPDIVNGKMTNRYTANPSEISIVDRPCVPAAKFFTVHKADGSDIQVSFSESLMLPTEGSAMDGAPAGLGLFAKGKSEDLLKDLGAVMVPDTATEGPSLAKADDQPRDDHGRFGSGDGATAANSKADAHGKMASLHERAAAASKTPEFQAAHTAASKAHDKAAESYRTAAAHFGTGNVATGNTWMNDSDKLGAKASGKTDALRRSHQSEFSKDDAGASNMPTSPTSGLQTYDLEGGKKPKAKKSQKEIEDEEAKATAAALPADKNPNAADAIATDPNGGFGGKATKIARVKLLMKSTAQEANAMEQTGKAVAATNEAITTNDYDMHQAAANAHADAAQAHIELDNSEMASHHIAAAKAHMGMPSKAKTAKAHGLSVH